jgi:hypothetical protein
MKTAMIQKECEQWKANVMSFSSLILYRTMKTELYCEKYLDMGLNKRDINLLVRLRGSMLKIRLKEGRWYGIERKRPICNSGNVEDEMHIIFKCTAWSHHRTLTGIRKHFFIQEDKILAFTQPCNDSVRCLVKFLKSVPEEREVMLEVLN